MPFVDYLLPDLASQELVLLGRDRRREMTITAEMECKQELDGFARIEVTESCPGGDPLVLRFNFIEADPDGGMNSKIMAVDAFMLRLQTTWPRAGRRLQMRRTAIIRPLRDFCRPDRLNQAMWKQITLPIVENRASRATLGKMFIQLDYNLSSAGNDVVVLSFADHEYLDYGSLVDAFADALKFGAN